jgi:hypothetical protein
LAIGGAAKIHVGVEKLVAAFSASSGGVILEKLHLAPTLGALGFKDGTRLPVATILSRTFHRFYPSFLGKLQLHLFLAVSLVGVSRLWCCCFDPLQTTNNQRPEFLPE